MFVAANIEEKKPAAVVPRDKKIGSGLSMMVVEDDAMNMMLINEVLTRMGLTVLKQRMERRRSKCLR